MSTITEPWFTAEDVAEDDVIADQKASAEDTISCNTRNSTNTAVNLLNVYRQRIAPGTHLTPFQDMPTTELVKLMKNFFQTVRRENNELYEPSSLITIFFGIKRHFTQDLGINFEHPQLKELGAHLTAACKALKRKGKGKLPNRIDPLTPHEVKLLFSSGSAGPHNPLALRNAMVVICLILGRRARSELRSTCLGDLVVEVVDGVRFLTLNKDRDTRDNLNSSSSSRLHSDRGGGVGSLAADPIHPQYCVVSIFMKYRAARPERACHPDSPMFLSLAKKGSLDPRSPFKSPLSRWFTNKPCGVNTLAAAVKDMVDLIGLEVGERKISNSSVRKMVVTTFHQQGHGMESSSVAPNILDFSQLNSHMNQEIVPYPATVPESHGRKGSIPSVKQEIMQEAEVFDQPSSPRPDPTMPKLVLA